MTAPGLQPYLGKAKLNHADIHAAELDFVSGSKNLYADKKSAARHSKSWKSEIQFCMEMVSSNRIDDVSIRLLFTISMHDWIDIVVHAERKQTQSFPPPSRAVVHDGEHPARHALRSLSRQ